MKFAKFISTIVMLYVSFAFIASSETATDVVKKMDDKINGKTSQAEMTVKIIRPSWSRDLSMKLWTKGSDYSMILLTAPVKEKGNAYLKRSKEVWNWVPGIEKTIKLPPSMMSQAWMGTDFTNDDLVKHSSIVTDYDHSFSKDSTVDGRTCYKIIMKPKPDAAVVWGKIIMCIDKKDYIQIRTEYYDEDGILINILRGTNIKMLGGKMLASQIEMIPVANKGNKTILIYNFLEFDKDISDAFFVPEKMKTLK